MQIDNILQKENIKQTYDYMRSLGYSHEASFVLACITYNSLEAQALQKHLKRFSFKAAYAFLEKISDEKWKTVVYPPAVKRSFAMGSFMRKSGSNVCYGSHVSYCRAPGDYAYESVMFAPSMEMFATDSYEHIEEKDANSVFTNPLSTFRLSSNTASMGIVLNQIRSGRPVRQSQVRIEELLNYADYTVPESGDNLQIYTEVMQKSKNKKLLFIDVHAKSRQKEHQNIVFLLDVSGSMSSNARATQDAMAVIISKLQVGDVFSLVTYCNKDEVIFDGRKIKKESDKEKILGQLYKLRIGGCTYGSAGIEKAYQIGEAHYHKDWNNQVILMTDGDLNFGITDKDGLQGLIAKEKEKNIFLSIIGTGLWNYQDDMLETLAKNGNGIYCVADTQSDIGHSIDKRFTQLTHVAYKDAKAQVEFNPKYVKSYRLLGYESRELQAGDFANDNVISEPVGNGSHTIALYELTMNDGTDMPQLKYQTPVVSDSDELCTVSVRCKEPLSDSSKLFTKVVKPEETEHNNLQLAYYLYCLAELLRQSDKLDEADKEFVSSWQMPVPEYIQKIQNYLENPAQLSDETLYDDFYL